MEGLAAEVVPDAEGDDFVEGGELGVEGGDGLGGGDDYGGGDAGYGCFEGDVFSGDGVEGDGGVRAEGCEGYTEGVGEG